MNPSVYFNLAKQAFKRNNPFMEMAAQLYQVIQMLLNYKSSVKLNKYRHNLYMQQLQRMEGFIAQGSPYHYRGGKIDRRF